MKKITKVVLSLVLALAFVVAPAANNYEAAEADPTTQGVITCANMYDWNFGSYNDVMAFISLDDTQTLSTLTGQDDVTVFGWFYNALLEYDEAKGAWVVTKADLEQDGVNANATTTLGEGKMVVMFHDNVTKTNQASFDFYKENLVDGKELYLGVHPSALYDVYDYVDGAYLSSVPVEVEEPEVEEPADDKKDDAADKKDDAVADKDADKEGKDNTLMIVVIAVAAVAVVAVVVVVIVASKRKK